MRFTVALVRTVWSGPALATGALFGGASTVTVTVSASESSVPSLTTRLNSSSPASVGVNFGVAEVASSRVTSSSPPVWVHAKVSSSSSASEDSLPSRVTSSPTRTVWGSPATATGAVLAEGPSKTTSVAPSKMAVLVPASAGRPTTASRIVPNGQPAGAPMASTPKSLFTSLKVPSSR